jgi:hypothetical protein
MLRLAQMRLWPATAVGFLCLASPSEMAARTGLTPEELLAKDVGTFVTELKGVPPLPEDVKAAVLKSLPTEGRVTRLKGSAQRKIASLRSILYVYERDSVYEIVVVSVRQAFVGLYERAAVLISEEALRLLSAAELQALVAHEMGHDYYWHQYRAAESSRDGATLRTLELYCDAVAVIALIQAGIDTANLISGLDKVTRFNAQSFGQAFNESSYPSLSDRRYFATQVAAWATAGACRGRCGNARHADYAESGQHTTLVLPAPQY